VQKRDSNKVAGQDDVIRLQLVDKQNCSGNRFCCEKWMIVEVAEMRDCEVVENGRKTLQSGRGQPGEDCRSLTCYFRFP